jgi:hypothetical protein
MILFIIALFAAVALLAAFCVWWIGGPVFSAGTLLSLRGKTQEEVRQILGEPSEIGESGEWYYNHPRNAGWVTIRFYAGRIFSVDDEQAAPNLFGSGSWWDRTVSPATETPDTTPDSN